MFKIKSLFFQRLNFELIGNGEKVTRLLRHSCASIFTGRYEMKKLSLGLLCMVLAAALSYSADSDTVAGKVQSDSAHAQSGQNTNEKNKSKPFSMRMGLTVDALGASNAVPISELFNLTSATDPKKLLENAIKPGAHTGLLFNLGGFFQFTLQGIHTVKLSTTADGVIRVDESKSISELIKQVNDLQNSNDLATALAKIDKINNKGHIELNTNLRAFADTGVMYEFKQPAYDISARLAYFVPLAYMEPPAATVKVQPIGTGVRVTARGNAAAYGLIPASLAEKQLSAADFFKNGGLDISLAGSYTLTDWVTLTNEIRHIPIVPSRTDIGMAASFNLDKYIYSFTPAEEIVQGFKMDYASAHLPKKTIMRLCKFKIGADFRPFQNNHLIVSPFFALPFAKEKPYYVDNGLKIESRFARVLGAYFNTGYIDRIWRHELGLLLDSRFFSLNLAASLTAHTLKETFKSPGVGFKIGVSAGF